MIIKFLSRKSNSKQLLEYILRYIVDDNKLTKNDLTINDSNVRPNKFIIRHNVRARSIKGFLREFNENESYRIVHRKDSVQVFHTIVSFSNKDKELINDKLLKDIANKFIEERGSNILHVGSKHEDKEHIHMHICSSGTQLNGRSARISNQKFKSIKLSLDRYQRENYPFLVNSRPEHGKSKRLAKEALLESFKTNRQSNKAALLEKLEEVSSNAISKEDFLSQIRNLGHEPYFRTGKLQGVLFEGKVKYRFSRLGFDQERLERIGEGISLIKGLQELKAIRQLEPMERETKHAKLLQTEPVKMAKTDKMQIKLAELTSIRNKNWVLDKEKDEDLDMTRSLDTETVQAENYEDGEGHQPSLFPAGIPEFSLLKLTKQI